MRFKVFLFFLFASLCAQEIPTTFEARASYFWPESQDVRNLYGSGPLYQLTGTVAIYQKGNYALRGLNIWWAVDYFYRTGYASTLFTPTRLQSEEISAGLKWILPEYSIRPYAGVAFKYGFVQTHNSSSYVKKRVSTSAPGFAVETGFMVFLGKYLILDLFASYTYLYYSAPSIGLLNIESADLNLSGLNFGGGIGTKF